jgi:hypothetical protein
VEKKMSLSTMTNDLARPGGGKQTIMAVAYNHAPEGSPTSNKSNSKAFDAVAKFIPTEVLAPYILVAGLAKNNTSNWTPEGAFFAFIFITPLLLVLFEFAKAAEQKLAWPATTQLLWRAAAATIAFAVWSLSIPHNPYQEAVGGIVVTGVLAVLISPTLAALDSIVMRVLALKA